MRSSGPVRARGDDAGLPRSSYDEVAELAARLEEEDELDRLLDACADAYGDFLELTHTPEGAGARRSTRRALRGGLLLLHGRSAEVMGREPFAEVFTEAVQMDLDVALKLLEMPAAACLPREALLPLLGSERADVRLAAIAHLGHTLEGRTGSGRLGDSGQEDRQAETPPHTGRCTFLHESQLPRRK
jgi:hypothetical protein